MYSKKIVSAPQSIEVELPQENESLEKSLTYLAYGMIMGMAVAAAIFLWRLRSKKTVHVSDDFN